MFLLCVLCGRNFNHKGHRDFTEITECKDNRISASGEETRIVVICSVVAMTFFDMAIHGNYSKGAINRTSTRSVIMGAFLICHLSAAVRKG